MRSLSKRGLREDCKLSRAKERITKGFGVWFCASRETGERWRASIKRGLNVECRDREESEMRRRGTRRRDKVSTRLGEGQDSEGEGSKSNEGGESEGGGSGSGSDGRSGRADGGKRGKEGEEGQRGVES